MSDQHRHPLEAHVTDLGSRLSELRDLMARYSLAGEIERFAFSTTQLRQMDDRGSNCLSYAVYNPNDFKVFIGLAGASADADGLVVPAQKLVVAPLQVNGHIELGVDAGEVGEGGAVHRVRFPVPQPFSVSSLE